VQDVLKSYIPLRINADLNENLANRYKVNWYPAHVILNEDGEKLGAVRYYMKPPDPLAFIKVLNGGLALYAKYAEGVSIEDQQITEVTNIDDAIILSKSKQLPVLVLVLSKDSKWSNKLLKETFKNPSLQADLKNVILVKVDQAVNKSLIKKWNITYFPTILFLDDNGETLYQILGYQPPSVLANMITDLNVVMSNDTKYKERITWLYNLEEAKSFAAIQKKDIFVFVNADWCPHCPRMIDHVFTNPFVIETINDKFVAVELDDTRDAELLKTFGIRAFPTLLLLDASLAEIIRLIGYYGASRLMPVLDLEDRKPIYSILGQDKYQKFYNYESLSDQLYRKSFYLSAIQAMQKQIGIFSDYWKSYFRIGNAYLYLNNPRETVSYYTKAIDKGAEINQNFAAKMLNAYLQLNDVRGFEKWFRNLTKSKNKDSNETASLYDVCSEYYEILKDRKSAIQVAEQALKIKPDNIAVLIRLGRLYYLENRFDEAIYHLTKAVQVNKDDPQPCFYLGLIADRKGDTKEKERYFDLARQRSHQAAHQVGWRYRYHFRSGYYLYPGYLDLIEQGYRYYIELDDDVNVKNALAYFLAVESRNLDEALQLIEDVLVEMPEDVDFLDTKAVILYQRREYQKAHETVLQYEKRFTKEDLEEYPSYSYYMGRIKWAVGDTVSAKYYFNITLKQTNPDADGRRHQEELKIFMAENDF
jgi:thioredoxin-related protein/Tfp pilus assembly protein PilF